jgi:hypothetical protein
MNSDYGAVLRPALMRGGRFLTSRTYKMKISATPLIIGLVTASSVCAGTQTVKLSCVLDIIVHHPFGEPDKSRETVTVEMQSDPGSNFRAILINSLTIAVSVGNAKGGSVTSYKDNSTEDRWEIWNDRTQGRTQSEQMAAIDRNTGQLTAYESTMVGSVSERTEASGTCNKLDISKRKF